MHPSRAALRVPDLGSLLDGHPALGAVRLGRRDAQRVGGVLPPPTSTPRRRVPSVELEAQRLRGIPFVDRCASSPALCAEGGRLLEQPGPHGGVAARQAKERSARRRCGSPAKKERMRC
jgi:hypothetical protein